VFFTENKRNLYISFSLQQGSLKVKKKQSSPTQTILILIDSIGLQKCSSHDTALLVRLNQITTLPLKVV
jgi:hypothetical protein